MCLTAAVLSLTAKDCLQGKGRCGLAGEIWALLLVQWPRSSQHISAALCLPPRGLLYEHQVFGGAVAHEIPQETITWHCILWKS